MNTRTNTIGSIMAWTFVLSLASAYVIWCQSMEESARFFR